MNIGFDLDGTLIEFMTPFIKQIAMEFHVKESDFPKQNDFYFSNFSQEFRNRLQELIIDKNFMGPGNATADIYTVYALLHFKEQEHKLIVITARAEEIRKETEDIINGFFPTIFDKVILTKCTKDKIDIMKSEKLDCWIDDNPEGCKISISLGIPTFLIYNNYTAPYAEPLFSEYIAGIDFQPVKSINEIYTKKLLEKINRSTT